MKKEPLNAIYDDDLEELLVSLGLIGDLENGSLRCAFCREPISKETLHAIFPDSGTIKASCNRPSCVTNLVSFASEKNI